PEVEMATKVYAGTEVILDNDGFFADPRQWRAEMAPQIARESGIDSLTAQHWQGDKVMRPEDAEKGTGPTVAALDENSRGSIKELYQLFPKGPAKLAAKIAGIPKPRGCI